MCSLLRVKDASTALLRGKACVKGASVWPEAKFLGSLHVSSLEGGQGGEENTYLTRAFETLGCSSEHSAVHILGEHSLLSLLSWILFSSHFLSETPVFSLSLCSTSTFRNQKVHFFLSQKLIQKQGRAHRMSRQSCEGMPAQC